MEENNYNLGPRTETIDLHQAGIGQIIIPSDVDRANYIALCYNTATVSINTSNGVLNRVPVDRYSINFIRFPEKVNEFGSSVSFKIDSAKNRPMVDGIFYSGSELCDLQEHQFKFKRSFNNNTVEISGSPDGKYLSLNVYAIQGGEVIVNVKSKDESGKVSINVEGECHITSLTDTTLQQYGSLKMNTVNRNDPSQFTYEEHTAAGRKIASRENILISEKIVIGTDSLIINKGEENFVLGKKLKGFLKNLIREIANATVTTQLGPMPLLNKAQISLYEQDDKIDSILSEVGFLNK